MNEVAVLQQVQQYVGHRVGKYKNGYLAMKLPSGVTLEKWLVDPALSSDAEVAAMLGNSTTGGNLRWLLERDVFQPMRTFRVTHNNLNPANILVEVVQKSPPEYKLRAINWGKGSLTYNAGVDVDGFASSLQTNSAFAPKLQAARGYTIPTTTLTGFTIQAKALRNNNGAGAAPEGDLAFVLATPGGPPSTLKSVPTSNPTKVSVAVRVNSDIVVVSAAALTSYQVMMDLDLKKGEVHAAVISYADAAVGITPADIGGTFGFVAAGPIGSFVGSAISASTVVSAPQEPPVSVPTGFFAANFIAWGDFNYTQVDRSNQIKTTLLSPYFLSKRMPQIPLAWFQKLVVEKNYGYPMTVQEFTSYLGEVEGDFADSYGTSSYKPSWIYSPWRHSWHLCKGSPTTCGPKPQLWVMDWATGNGLESSAPPQEYYTVCGKLSGQTFPVDHVVPCPDGSSMKITKSGLVKV